MRTFSQMVYPRMERFLTFCSGRSVSFLVTPFAHEKKQTWSPSLTKSSRSCRVEVVARYQAPGTCYDSCLASNICRFCAVVEVYTSTLNDVNHSIAIKIQAIVYQVPGTSCLGTQAYWQYIYSRIVCPNARKANMESETRS